MFIWVIILFVVVLFLLFWFFRSKQIENQQNFHQPDSDSSNQYKFDAQAVVISCYFNPQNNPYRRKAFDLFYDKIKHLNHRIIECVIGDTNPELPENENIKRVYTKNLLWHKEALLNKIIAELPPQFKYIFWVDADVIFANEDWLIQGVKELQTYQIIQPFEYCVHLEKDQTSFQGNPAQQNQAIKNRILAGERVENIRVWKSFCAIYGENPNKNLSHYDLHGHVGFAWGAQREILAKVPLYDRALIGGADHIIAHAAVGQIPHECITKAFSENIDEINDWSRRFSAAVGNVNPVGFVRGTLLHLWHGDLKKRDYLNRIQANTPKIKEIRRKDENGLYETDDDAFVHQYFATREVREDESDDYDSSDFDYDYSNSDNYSSQSDYANSSENRDYFQSKTVDFVGGGAGGSWENEVNAASAELSASLETSSTFS